MFRPDGTNDRIQFSAGHWTDRVNRTGCTVVAFNRAAPAIVDVRGGAPGTRETDLLGPGMLVQRVDAIVLAGGSAFGLAAADGVIAELRAAGRGVSTPGGPVPIVPAAVIFDLSVGESVWPTAESGREAFRARTEISSLARGQIGAGTGATSGKLFRPNDPDPGGVGYSYVELSGGERVHALVVVNAAGVVVDPQNGRSIVDPKRLDRRDQLLQTLASPPGERSSTTLTIVIVEAPADRRALERCGVAAHDGMARAIQPCHTIFDGDVVFAVGLECESQAAVDVLRLGIATELAVERAILDAINAT